MSLTSLSLALMLAALTACTSGRVVPTPTPVPEPGSPIRLATRTNPSQLIAARLVSLDADTLAFERLVPGDRPHWVAVRLSTDSISQVQTRVGRHANGGRGALIGGGLGLGLGLLCAGAYDESDWLAPTPGECMFSGAVSGAATGSLIGLLSKTELWAPVSLPRRPAVEPFAPVAADLP